MAEHLRAELVVDGLAMAAGRGQLRDGCIFQSDQGSQGSLVDRVKGGLQQAHVVAWAPSIAQPSGMSWRSEATDHFQPSLARSVGVGPVPSPP